MDSLWIEGGRKLEGRVPVSGAKNSALPIMASSILSEGTLSLDNVPRLKDVDTMSRLLAGMGAVIEADSDRFTIDFRRLENCKAPYDMVKTMRASVLVLGPLLARKSEAVVSLPGGCLIGARPVGIHLDGLEKMGAEVKIEHGYIHAKAAKLVGARIYLDFPTVTGTENLMMAAVLADGTTIIENAACEPEITDLACCLVRRGARISGYGTDTIVIEGVKSISSGQYEIMPDRIEAATFLAAGAVGGGEVFVDGCPPGFLESVLLKLNSASVNLKAKKNGVLVKGNGKRKGFDLKTMPYPGFPTDMQAQMMTVAAISEGVSVFSETVFENRYNHVQELRRMGADISISGATAVIRGVKTLTAAKVMASDLRASASLVIAGLVADGITRISRIYHLDRGYEGIEKKLAGIGANVRREHGE